MRNRPMRLRLALLALCAMLTGAGPAAAANAITQALEGDWSGSGRLTLTNGKSERIRCHGKASASDIKVRQSFSCASTGKNFSFSTSLTLSGNLVSGDWRGPDRTGTLSGRATSSSLSLRLLSGTGNGALNAKIGRCSLSLTVTGWSDELRSLTINLRKPC